MNLVLLLDFHLVSPQKLMKISFEIFRYFLIPLGLFNLNSGYKIFWITGYLVIFSLIPMIVIIRNNIIILLELQSTSKMKREKTAMVLFATVTVFLVCHALRFVETGMIIWNPITKFQTEYCGILNRYGNNLIITSPKTNELKNHIETI